MCNTGNSPVEILNDKGCKMADRLWRLVDTECGHSGNGLLAMPPYWILLEIAMDLDTSEPRDRIFGMLGLKQWWNGIPQALTPDYKREIPGLLRDATRCALDDDPRHAMWIWVYTSWQSDAELEDDNCMSWVPNWSRQWSHFEDAAPLQPIFRPGDKIQPPRGVFSPGNIIDSNILELHGIKISEVDDVTPVLNYATADRPSRLGRWLDKVTSFTTRWDEAATVLFAGTNVDNTPATAEDIEAYNDFKTLIWEENRFPPSKDDFTSRTTAHERAASRYEYAFRNASAQRRVFHTEAGHVGVGPKVTRPGDIVVIVFGGYTPLLLRPWGNNYRLLGASYVYGIMHGEAMGSYLDGEQKSTVFHIK